MRRAAVVLALLVASCESPLCGCSPIGDAAWAVVDGTVVDAQAMSVAGAEVAPVGVLRIECSTDGDPVAANPVPAVTDASGRFTMTLVTGLEGEHCVDFEISSPSSVVADTVRDLAIPFVLDYLPPDTLSVTLATSW